MFVLLYTNIIFSSIPPPSPLIRTYACFIFILFHTTHSLFTTCSCCRDQQRRWRRQRPKTAPTHSKQGGYIRSHMVSNIFMFLILLSIVYYVCFTLYSHLFSLLSPPPFTLIRTYACFIFICFILLTLCLLLAAAAERSKEDGKDKEQPDPQQTRRIHQEPHGK